jgi:hypothetical protein
LLRHGPDHERTVFAGRRGDQRLAVHRHDAVTLEQRRARRERREYLTLRELCVEDADHPLAGNGELLGAGPAQGLLSNEGQHLDRAGPGIAHVDAIHGVVGHHVHQPAPPVGRRHDVVHARGLGKTHEYPPVGQRALPDPRDIGYVDAGRVQSRHLPPTAQHDAPAIWRQPDPQRLG